MKYQGGCFMSTFYIIVKKILEEKHMTQKDLSLLSGVSEASLCRYLSGNKEPRMDVINNIAKALGVKPNYLLGKEEKKQDDEYETVKMLVARNKKIFTEDQKAEIIKMLFK